MAGPVSGSVLQNHPTQNPTTINGWAAALFGLPFLAIGVWISHGAFGTIARQPHTPRWAIGMFGAIFFFPGLFLFIHGVRGVIRKSIYRRAASQRPGEPWLYDFHWHREGVAFSAFNAMLGRLLAALVWSAFLVPFFWIGFTVHGAFVFAIFAGIFALFGLIFWYRWAQMLADLLRYGNSFLSYDTFPYFLGGNFSAHLRVPHHVEDMESLTLTLRCVSEDYVTSGTGKNRTTSVVCCELYSDVTTIANERLAGIAGGELSFQFRLPADQPPTSLISTPPTYWEIQAQGNSGKISYEAYFLVPVYKPV